MCMAVPRKMVLGKSFASKKKSHNNYQVQVFFHK